MKKDTIKIGLLGMGTVGSGVVKILTGNSENIGHKLGVGLEIKRIAVRDLEKPRAVEVDPALLTDNPDHVLLDPEIDIVVETMGGSETARQAITRALEYGKFVVTANKDLMAHHGVEL